MIAKVTRIESGEGYSDKERRVTLKFVEGQWHHDTIVLRESVIVAPPRHVELDMEFRVSFAMVHDLTGERNWVG